MNYTNIKNLEIAEGLIETNDPIWQNLLNNPRINELFDGIKQAEKDIKKGIKGKDFDEYFNELNRSHFNGELF